MITRNKNPKFDREIFKKWQLKYMFFKPVMVFKPKFVNGTEPM